MVLVTLLLTSNNFNLKSMSLLNEEIHVLSQHWRNQKNPLTCYSIVFIAVFKQIFSRKGVVNIEL